MTTSLRWGFKHVDLLLSYGQNDAKFPVNNPVEGLSFLDEHMTQDLGILEDISNVMETRQGNKWYPAHCIV